MLIRTIVFFTTLWLLAWPSHAQSPTDVINSVGVPGSTPRKPVEKNTLLALAQRLEQMGRSPQTAFELLASKRIYEMGETIELAARSPEAGFLTLLLTDENSPPKLSDFDSIRIEAGQRIYISGGQQSEYKLVASLPAGRIKITAFITKYSLQNTTNERLPDDIAIIRASNSINIRVQPNKHLKKP